MISSGVSGTYNYPGVYKSPSVGSGIATVGRGPIDAYIINTVITASLSSSFGTTEVSIKYLSGTTYSLSSTFTSSDWSTLFPATDVSLWSNISISVVNNHATNALSGCSVEWSPNSINWETDWDTTTFKGLAAGSMSSMQITGNSRKYLKLRGAASGTVLTAFSGSTDVYVTCNNG